MSFKDDFDEVQDVQLRKKPTQGRDGTDVKTCRVLFSYEPSHDDELELVLGDIIYYHLEVEDGWWKGCDSSGKQGVFPSNFVEVIPDISPMNLPRDDEKSKIKIPSSNNETTKNLPNVNGHGTAVISNGQQKQNGRNSKTSLESRDICAVPILPPKPEKEQYVVLFPYVAANEDELTLEKGDVITLVTKDVKDQRWWKGELNGKIGLFSDNFVRNISLLPEGTNISRSSDDNAFQKSDGIMLVSEVEAAKKVSDPSCIKKNTSKSEKEKEKEQYVVLFPYTAVNDDELSLKEDDVITLVTKDVKDEGWWKGELNGKIGLFPDNFVGLKSLSKDPKIIHPSQNSNQSSNVMKLPEDEVAKKVSKPMFFETNSSSVKKTGIKKEQYVVLFPYTAVNEDELSLEKGDIITLVTKDVKDQGWWKGELKGRIGVFPDNFVRLISHAEGSNILLLPNNTTQNPDVAKLCEDEQTKNVSNSSNPKKTAPHIGKTTYSNDDGNNVIRKKHSNTKPAAPQHPKSVYLKSKKSLVNTANTEGDNQGAGNAELAKSATTVVSDEKACSDLDIVRRRETLSHPTATRAKPPKRRPPSTILTKGASLDSNGNDIHSNVSPKDSLSSVKLIPPPPGVTEKSSFSKSSEDVCNKPVWLQKLCLKQARRKSETFTRGEEKETAADDIKDANLPTAGGGGGIKKPSLVVHSLANSGVTPIATEKKPSVPVKPSQIREDVWTNAVRPGSLRSGSTVKKVNHDTVQGSVGSCEKGLPNQVIKSTSGEVQFHWCDCVDKNDSKLSCGALIKELEHRVEEIMFEFELKYKELQDALSVERQKRVALECQVAKLQEHTLLSDSTSK